jgi:hypothetical protein
MGVRRDGAAHGSIEVLCMHRGLWLGAALFVVAGVQCTSSSGDGGDNNPATTEAGAVLPEGGISDESGTGPSTPPDTTPPTFAGIKSATALGETQVGIAWDPATDDKTAQGTIAYRVYVADKASGEVFTTPVLTAPAGATGATVSALHPFKQYYFVVRAVDGAGNEDKNTVEANATTLDTHPPEFGGAKGAQGTGAHDVLVSWNAATDNGSDPAALKYEVYATTTQGGENFLVPSIISAPGATSATVTGLPEATQIFFVVRVVDENGNRDANRHEITGYTLDKTPPAFAGLSTADTLGTTINLSWAAATDNADLQPTLKYDVFQATTAGGQDFNTPNFTTSAGATSFPVTNLAVSTKYYFVVRAKDTSGNVDTNTVEKSATTAASPDVTPPTFAGLSSAIATTDQSIDLSWTAATDDYSQPADIVYDIFVAGAAGGEAYASPSFTTVAGATNFTVTGLLPLTKSYFVVRARDVVGNQNKNTVEKSATTLADTIPPTFAGLESATPTSPTAIQLSWSAATDDVSASNTIKYRVFQSATPGGEVYASPTINVGAGQTSVVVNGLQPNTSYYFVVRAVDEAGVADTNTIEKSGKTPQDTTPPTFAGATGITALSATSISVSWGTATDDVTPSGNIVFLPYLATSAGGENYLSNPTPTAGGASTYTFTGLTPNTPYYVVVRAKDAAGNIDQNTNEQSISTQQDVTAPTFGGATNVTNASDQSLRLNWNPATDNSTAPANIVYSICVTQVNGGCNGGSFVETTTATGVTNKTFTGLNPSNTYYYVVRAKDAYGNTDTNSTQVSGSTIADLVAPTFAGLTGASSASATTIDLTWAAASDDLTPANQLVYDIYQSLTPGGENYLSASYTTVAGATTYKVQNLVPGTKYYFVARARDQHGNHDTGAAVERNATVQNDTTPPTFGGVTSVSATGLTSLHASWNAATDNVPAQQGNIVYYVCWSTGATCTSAFSAMATTAAGALSYDITGLLADTTYNVVVRAHDVYGNTDANTNSIAKKTNADTTAPVFTGSPQVTGQTSNSITLQWSTANDNYSPQASLQYLVCKAQTATGCTGVNFSPTLTLTNQFTTTFNGLANLQTFYFVVRVRDPAGNTDTNDNVVSAATVSDTTAPTFGGLSSATQTGDNQILLQWSAASDDVSLPAQIVYDIFQAPTTSGTESYAAPTFTTGAGATQYTVQNLQPQTAYYFVVRARDTAGNHDVNTTEKTATTAADNVAPGFGGVTSVAVVSDSQLQANWTAATDDTTPQAQIVYQVCWAVGNGCTTSFNAMATTAAGATSYTTPVKTLVPSTTYTFVVRAKDTHTNVDTNTTTKSNTTLDDLVVPTFGGAASVTNLTYTPGTGAVNATVNWAIATDDYTSTANMRYAICHTPLNGGCNDNAFVADAVLTNQTSYTYTNLNPNTLYYFVVRAEDQANNFNTTNQNLQVQGTTAQETTAPTFGGLGSIDTATTSSLTLHWAAATDQYSGPTQITYSIYRATSPGAENYASPIATVAGVAGTNNYLATGLNPYTTYYFVVRAKDAALNQETNTTEKSAATLATAPTWTVQPHTTASTTTSLTWAWTTTSSIATTYQYCHSSVAANCNNFAAGLVSGTSTGNGGTDAFVAVGGLSAYTTYYIVVKAINSTGSTYSNGGINDATDPTNPTMSGSVSCYSSINYPSADYVANQYDQWMRVGWTAASPGGGTNGSIALQSPAYQVCYSTSSCSCGSSLGCGIFGATETINLSSGKWYLGGSLTSNTTYYIRARAIDQLGHVSNIITGTCTTPVSGSTDVDPWFSGHCSGCHGWTTGGLTGAGNNSSCGSAPFYIDRTNHTTGASFIWLKINGTQPCGARMPNGGPYTAPPAVLTNWITQGGFTN